MLQEKGWKGLARVRRALSVSGTGWPEPHHRLLPAHPLLASLSRASISWAAVISDRRLGDLNKTQMYSPSVLEGPACVLSHPVMPDSCICCIGRKILYHCTTREALSQSWRPEGQPGCWQATLPLQALEGAPSWPLPTLCSPGCSWACGCLTPVSAPSLLFSQCFL